MVVSALSIIDTTTTTTTAAVVLSYQQGHTLRFPSAVSFSFSLIYSIIFLLSYLSFPLFALFDRSNRKHTGTHGATHCGTTVLLAGCVFELSVTPTRDEKRERTLCTATCNADLSVFSLVFISAGVALCPVLFLLFYYSLSELSW